MVVSKNLTEFYKVNPQDQKPLTYSGMQDAIWGAEASGGEIHLPSSEAVQETAAQIGERVISLGKNLKEVTDMLLSARITHDPYGRGLDAVVGKYHPEQDPPLHVVRLSKELVDKYGGDANKIQFGVLKLDQDETKAKAQLQKLEELAEAGRPFLGDMQIETAIDKRGNKVAIVIGTDEKFSAKAFNAVTNAIGEQRSLGTQYAAAQEDLKQKLKEKPPETEVAAVNPDKMKELQDKYPNKQPPQQEQGSQVADAKALQTPAVNKDKELSVLAVA